MKELFWKYYTHTHFFDTQLASTLTIFSEKDSKYASVSLKWALAIILVDQCPLGFFLSNMYLASFHLPYLGWKN